MAKKAVILVGGLGTRLRPVTYEIPKPLLTVKRKPIVSHLIDLFRRHGVEKIALLASVNHRPDFEQWQKARPDEAEGVELFFEESPRGTFGGLRDLRDWIGSESFFLSNGDELKDFDLNALRNFHAGHTGVGTLALVAVEKPQEYGVPVMENNIIREFLEKPANPPSNLVSAGFYVLNPEIFNFADFKQDFIMIEKDIFPKAAAAGRLFGLPLTGRWYDCGTFERWEKAIKEW